MLTDLKKLMRNYDIRKYEDLQIRSIRTILRKERKYWNDFVLSHHIRPKFRLFIRWFRYYWNVYSKLTTKDLQLACTHRATMFDVVDFIHNVYSPYLKR